MKLLLVFLLLLFTCSSAFPEEVGEKSVEVNTVKLKDGLFYNVSFGVSAFECMFGVEIQKGSHSVGLGICGQLSYRYYTDPHSDGLFYGLYAGYKSGYLQRESKKESNGVIYEDKESMFAGFGVGYRWQWLSGWNANTSLSIHYMHDEYTNPGQPKKKERSVILFPGITVGYKF